MQEWARQFTILLLLESFYHEIPWMFDWHLFSCLHVFTEKKTLEMCRTRVDSSLLKRPILFYWCWCSNYSDVYLFEIDTICKRTFQLLKISLAFRFTQTIHELLKQKIFFYEIFPVKWTNEQIPKSVIIVSFQKKIISKLQLLVWIQIFFLKKTCLKWLMM